MVFLLNSTIRTYRVGGRGCCLLKVLWGRNKGVQPIGDYNCYPGLILPVLIGDRGRSCNIDFVIDLCAAIR
jgi:hypothetical protein